MDLDPPFEGEVVGKAPVGFCVNMSKASLLLEIFDAQEHQEQVSTDPMTEYLQDSAVQSPHAPDQVASGPTMDESEDSYPPWDSITRTDQYADVAPRLEEPWDPNPPYSGYEPGLYEDTAEIAGLLGNVDWVPQQAPYPDQGQFDPVHQDQDFLGPNFQGSDFQGPDIQGLQMHEPGILDEISKRMDSYVAYSIHCFHSRYSLLIPNVE